MNTKASLWEYATGVPDNRLSNWVCSYNGYSENTRRSVHRLEVAKARAIVVIGFGGKWQISSVHKRTASISCQLFAVGLQSSPLLVKHSGVQHCIEIELLPWAANKLFNGAFADFSQNAIDLVNIWGSSVLRLAEKLSELNTWHSRFALIDQFLIQRFIESDYVIRPEIQWAWKQLEQSGGRLRVQSLAKTLGWSDRHFARCFREQVGITPKAAARRIRFTSAYRLLIAPEPHKLSAIALIAGYSDQSHFTREFHSFSGCAPKRYQQAHFIDLPGTPADVIEDF